MMDAHRQRLIRLLEERARLLALPEDVIKRGLERSRKGRVGQAGEAISSTHTPIEIDAQASGRLDRVEVDPEPCNRPIIVASAVATAPTVVRPGGAAAQIPPPPALVPSPPTVPADSLAPGTVIAGYRIEAFLGKGGMGQVYKATQLSMNRLVAFKVLAPHFAQNQDFRKRFLREARNTGRLHHPHLIAVHDVAEADGLLFFSMELVQGRTLGEILKEEKRLGEVRALSIVRQVLTALNYAHKQGVIHRDIKPDNLMLTRDGSVKVADLGLCRQDSEAGDGSDNQASSDAGTTRTGSILGTPYYMSPEQAQDPRKVDVRADLYSLGATLYHLVFGKPPFTGKTVVEVVVNASNQPLEFPRGEGSPGLRKLLLRLMAKHPKERPRSAELVMRQVDDLLNELTGGQGRSRRPRPRVLGWIGVGLTILLIVLLGLQVWREGTWSGLQARVQGFQASHDFCSALEVYDQAPTFWGFGQRLAAARSKLAAAWDDWAMTAIQTQAEDLERKLQANLTAQARQTVEAIVADRALASPAVQEWAKGKLADITEQAELSRGVHQSANPAARILFLLTRKLPSTAWKSIDDVTVLLRGSHGTMISFFRRLMDRTWTMTFKPQGSVVLVLKLTGTGREFRLTQHELSAVQVATHGSAPSTRQLQGEASLPVEATVAFSFTMLDANRCRVTVRIADQPFKAFGTDVLEVTNLYGLTLNWQTSHEATLRLQVQMGP